MSSWLPSMSGRYSPFTLFSSKSTGPPSVTEDDYSYLDGTGTSSHDRHLSGDEYVERQDNADSSSAQPLKKMTGAGAGSGSQRRLAKDTSESTGIQQNSRRDSLELEPDVLILRRQGTLIPLHFPAFAISDQSLLVGDVRRVAAKKLQIDEPARIKLLYKGRQLRNDNLPCKQEKLKQNSELLCVITTECEEFDTADSNQNSHHERDSGDAEELIDGRRKAGSSRKSNKNRAGGKRKPTSHVQADHIVSSKSRTSSPLPSPAPPKKPLTASETLAQIQDTFINDLLPMIQAYIAQPPPDAKAREFEYKKLSESTLAQVLIKLDGVDTAGDDSLRQKRRELVKIAQDWLNKLDAVGKA